MADYRLMRFALTMALSERDDRLNATHYSRSGSRKADAQHRKTGVHLLEPSCYCMGFAFSTSISDFTRYDLEQFKMQSHQLEIIM